MFHFPTFPPPALCVQAGVTGLASSRVSPFGNPRITVWLSTPRGLSQIPTSFFGSWYQGIHRAPLKTWPQRCSRPLCSSQNTGGTHHTRPPPHILKDMDGTTDRRGPTESTEQKTPEPSGPNNVPDTTHQAASRSPTCPEGQSRYLRSATDARCQIIDVPPLSNPRDTIGHDRATWTPSTRDRQPRGAEADSPAPVLLRKEVIQPHLPVRLPCYDLVPIASPTFDGSSP
jgi:hypothetical protein